MKERTAFVVAAFALWLVLVVQAIQTPILLDDWFQLRYWRDHELGLPGLWALAHHNYFHYNPRIGEVFLAIVDGSRAVHVIVTPLVQLALLPIVFVIAFARWPRRTLADLQLLLFIQTSIWLVVPIPGLMYFYRPFATNYLWAFTITLALFVPYRLALARGPAPPRRSLIPVMFVLGWVAGMCNEHTGPTAMVAIAGFVHAAWRLRRLRAWMVAGLVGLYLGYPMLFFAPGQAVRYGGLATRETPVRLLADRGVIGCLAIFRDFLFEARLGIVVFAAALTRYLVTLRLRGDRWAPPPRRAVIEAAVLTAASVAIVGTLFASPTASDRVLFAPGVLLVAAIAICADHLFRERVVRRAVVVACLIVFGFHVVRFVETTAEVKADNDARLAILRATPPGGVAVVPAYRTAWRSHWQLGDDFEYFPWLRDYVGGELFDLARVDLDRRDRARPVRLIATPALAHVPTYREVQRGRSWRDGGLTIRAFGVFDDPFRRPLFVLDGAAFVDGRPFDEPRGHFIRVAALPERTRAIYVIGCGHADRVDPVEGALLPVDERFCRGPFTAVACEPHRCWVAGWY